MTAQLPYHLFLTLSLSLVSSQGILFLFILGWSRVKRDSNVNRQAHRRKDIFILSFILLTQKSLSFRLIFVVVVVLIRRIKLRRWNEFLLFPPLLVYSAIVNFLIHASFRNLSSLSKVSWYLSSALLLRFDKSDRN